jgi:hypothetical protein
MFKIPPRTLVRNLQISNFFRTGTVESVAPCIGIGEGARVEFGGDTELAHDFIGLIQGKCSPRTPIWTGLQSVYCCLAAKESAETGQFVKVRQVGRTGV